MSVVILLICFIAIFFNLGIILSTKISLKEILLCSVLFFSTILLFITEISSLFHALNFQTILLSWIGVFVLQITFLFLRKNKFISFNIELKERFKNTFKDLQLYEKFLYFSVVVILLLVFIQSIVYPPNNDDSMAYHMARIIHWISHQSVAHYPSHNFRQIYQPPFAEFVIMHFNILNCGDYFSNSVQFFFLFFSLFAIVLIVELLGLNNRAKFIAVILAVTIPEVTLEASSTQNDIVVSFFILTSLYFAVKAFKELKFRNYFFLGLSIGLATLTKGTAYLFLTPILLIFGIAILIKIFRIKNFAYLYYLILTALLFVCINSGHFTRNYNFNKTILGVDKNESKMYSNEKMTPKLLMSNIIKNAGLQIGPYPINKLSDKIIYKIHSIAGIYINNHETTFGVNGCKEVYRSSSFPNSENTAPNPIHFYLILLSFILISIHILKNKKWNSNISLYSAIILLQAILFCLYLKWQPWHTRLQTPLFMLSVPFICYVASLKDTYIKILNIIIPIMVIYALFVILINNTRPFFSNEYTSGISITDNRYKKYYSHRLYLYDEFNATVESIKKLKYKNIGLIIREYDDDWEYPLFSQFYGKEINPIHINISNITKYIPMDKNNIDCIISTTVNDSIINYKGKSFRNQNIKDKVIWLYNPN